MDFPKNYLEKFKGFSRPNTTQTPDEIFDRFLPDLGLAELRVLLYIVRRTYGFKKDYDSISLRQITEGITTKEGKELDRGTGMTRRGALKAIQSLEKRGLIIVGRRKAEDGENEINVYSLRFKE